MNHADGARPLRTLTVSPRVIGGGAEKVALSLHEEYLTRGIDSWLAVGNCNGEAPQVVQIPNDAVRSSWARALLGPANALESHSARSGDVAGTLSRALRITAEPGRYARVARGWEDFDFPESSHLLEIVPGGLPDVAHFHNLHGSYFDIRALPSISAATPTMITMHDAWLLAGHCVHSLVCERWRTGCGECPDLGLYVPIRADASAHNWQVKRDAVRGSRLAIASPSEWLLRMIEASQLMHEGVDARCVPNGVDTRVFKPANKARARHALGLDQDIHVALIAAQGLRSSQFKGFDMLAKSLELLGGEDLGAQTVLVALGAKSPVERLGNVQIQFTEFLTDPRQVALYYQAADLYVHPSLAENLPLTVLEAMACGTAVVASDVGGIPELVVEGVTGLLVPATDPVALAHAIAALLRDAQLRSAMGAAAVDRVRAHFTLDRQVDTYLGWYAEMVEDRSREGVSR